MALTSAAHPRGGGHRPGPRCAEMAGHGPTLHLRDGRARPPTSGISARELAVSRGGGAAGPAWNTLRETNAFRRPIVQGAVHWFALPPGEPSEAATHPRGVGRDSPTRPSSCPSPARDSFLTSDATPVSRERTPSCSDRSRAGSSSASPHKRRYTNSSCR